MESVFCGNLLAMSYAKCTCGTEKKCLDELHERRASTCSSDEDCHVFSVITVCSRPNSSFYCNGNGLVFFVFPSSSTFVFAVAPRRKLSDR